MVEGEEREQEEGDEKEMHRHLPEPWSLRHRHVGLLAHEPELCPDHEGQEREEVERDRRALARPVSILKIIFVMWHRQVPYDEQYHLATMTRQQLRQRQKQSLDMNQRKSRRRAARRGGRPLLC